MRSLLAKAHQEEQDVKNAAAKKALPPTSTPAPTTKKPNRAKFMNIVKRIVSSFNCKQPGEQPNVIVKKTKTRKRQWQ